jgi:hypothetical protein
LKRIFTRFFTRFFTGILAGILKSILKAILKSFFKGIKQASPNDFTLQLHHDFLLQVINIILNGIFIGIIGLFSLILSRFFSR